MKKAFLLLSGVLVLSGAYAQFNVGGALKNKINQKANQTIDNSINNAGNGKKNKSQDNASDNQSQPSSNNNTSQSNTSAPAKKEDLISYSKYDFVPGDKIIFEDNVVDEQSGEFPSKWDLRNGNIEIATLNGESVIAFTEGNYASIAPLMSKSGDYLPDVFSIEFDAYFNSYDRVNFSLYDEKDYNSEEVLELSGWKSIGKSSSINQAEGRYPGDQDFLKKWHRMAITYNKGNIKLFVDQYRVANLPHAKGNPQGLMLGVIASPEEPVFIKNIRIAEGGGELYKRVATDDRIVTHGILFDVGKSTIMPYSMGTINEIAKVMKENSALKFSIEGHTDSDGDEAANLKLSQERAESVKNELVKLGIDASRLTTKGWGESKPIETGNSPEAKANNRRVEFVKQ